MIQKITQNNGNFWRVNLIMRAIIVNQSSDFPVRRTGSYRHKKALLILFLYVRVSFTVYFDGTVIQQQNRCVQSQQHFHGLAKSWCIPVPGLTKLSTGLHTLAEWLRPPVLLTLMQSPTAGEKIDIAPSVGVSNSSRSSSISGVGTGI